MNLFVSGFFILILLATSMYLGNISNSKDFDILCELNFLLNNAIYIYE